MLGVSPESPADRRRVGCAPRGVPSTCPPPRCPPPHSLRSPLNGRLFSPLVTPTPSPPPAPPPHRWTLWTPPAPGTSPLTPLSAPLSTAQRGSAPRATQTGSGCRRRGRRRRLRWGRRAPREAASRRPRSVPDSYQGVDGLGWAGGEARRGRAHAHRLPAADAGAAGRAERGLWWRRRRRRVAASPHISAISRPHLASLLGCRRRRQLAASPPAGAWSRGCGGGGREPEIARGSQRTAPSDGVSRRE